MLTKTSTIEKLNPIKNNSIKASFSKALIAKSEWPDKDEFLDVIYWSRQIIGVIIGIVWGIIPLKGFIALALFAAINAGFVYLYSMNFQEIDEEAFGGIWEVIKEGFMTSFAGFLVTWIIVYTGIHFDSLVPIKDI